MTRRFSFHLEGGRQLGVPVRPAGLREGQRAVPEGVLVQHQVPDHEAVRGGQGEQLQRGDGSGGAGRMPQRHRRHEAEPAVQLQVQERHEEGEELSPDLLEHIPEFARYVRTRCAGGIVRSKVLNPALRAET